MNEQAFSLIPFSLSGHLPGFKITGSVSRSSSIISISYSLAGPLSMIEIPAPAEAAARKDMLWEETCFELFLSTKNSRRYWEFNFSPSGHWNVYRFEDYRKAMEEEPAFSSIPFRIQIHPDTLQLTLGFNPDAIIPAEKVIEAAVSAVIKRADGKMIYLALTHGGTEADFHSRDSFILEL